MKVNGKLYLWRAVDHEGEVLEAVVTAKRDKAAALKFRCFREEPADHLHDLVAQIARQDTEPLGEGVEAPLEAEPCRQPVRAQIANRQEGVLPIPFRDIEGDAMEVLA